METIHVSEKDVLEICQDGDKYFLRYPTFNITMPEVVKEIPKEAVDSYLAGEHTGQELMNYAQLMVSGNLKINIQKMNLLSSSLKIIHL